MASLNEMTAQELANLLDEYGIKHGPVVDSTRSLYEKKLREAMAKGKKASPSSDKTFYREEEEEEVTYVYRTPSRHEGSGDRLHMRSRPEWTEREPEPNSATYSGYSRSEYRGRDFTDAYETPPSNRSPYLKATPRKPDQETQKAAKSSRLVPLWVQLLFFVAVAIFLYLVFISMETNEPLKVIE